MLVGSPFESSGQQKTGDIYRCPTHENNNCTKLNLGRVTLSNVSERKNNMRLGMTLATNPKAKSFVACSPLWSHECGSFYYSTGMCSRINSNFRFSKSIAPALQRCETYMDIVIVLDGSNSIYPWVEVQNFLINILQKFYIGPGQIHVGVVQYGEDVVHEFHLNDYKTVDQVVEAARHIEQRGGTETRTAFGIEIARSEAFKRGGRKGAKKVMIVITDGESHDSPDLKKVIEDSEKDNITRYAVAVLGYYNRRGINPKAFLNEIKFIASDPDEKHFFNVTDEAALKDIVDALGERIFSLEGTSTNQTSFGLEMSQAGFSSHIVEDGILLGAVGAYDWTGAVLKETSQGKVIPRRESYLQEFPEELKNHAAYLGYTVSSVMTANEGMLYVAGAPRFNHTGKVIIFKLNNNGNLTILQSLKGEQIGSYYGSEIDSVDIDKDGLTDVLLVGAPMYLSNGREKGKVYTYTLKQSKKLIAWSLLEVLENSQNSRFGSSISAVPDLNYDSYNDVAIGAPLEDDHQGAIYIFHGFKNNILHKFKQRIAASDLAPGLMYFGCSVHGELDMNDDGLVDLAVGSLGSAVLLWSRSIVQVNVTIKFEPPKINTFNKDCRRNGREATCMSAFICFNVTMKSPSFETDSMALTYGASIDERRYTPRAILDENNDKHIYKNLSAVAGQESCDQIYFHVLDTGDYVKPIIFLVEFELLNPDEGPILDDGWSTTFKSSVPFWNGCNKDEHCVPDLVVESKIDILNSKKYCLMLKDTDFDCTVYSDIDKPVFIVEKSRRKVAVDATLENKGENAYNTFLNISFTKNLHFASLSLKGDTDIKIECVNEEELYYKKVCNVSYPVFRSKAKVAFRLEFEFSRVFLSNNLAIYLEVSSDGEEAGNSENNLAKHVALLKYEANILFTRFSSLNHFEIKPNSSLDKYDSIFPPFNCSYKIQNLGFFPIESLTVKIKVPAFTKGGTRLLFLTNVYTDQKEGKLCSISGNNTDNRALHGKEDLMYYQQMDDSNTDHIFIGCHISLKSGEEVNIYIHGVLWIESLKTLKFKSMKLVTTGIIEKDIDNPAIFKEDKLIQKITIEITKLKDSNIPPWIIIGSILGGLILFALLVLALWKLGFFQSPSHNKKEEEQEQNGKVVEER
uniref:Integrin subunit alpha 11 n=1 Tax=Latimeria chalumnae TaxID=7897 RepID=H3B732_LATCH